MRIFNLIFFLLISISLLGNIPSDEEFTTGNTAYEKSDFSTAIKKYENLIFTQSQKGELSSELYYNLGNAYYKNKQLGKSLLNYERAKRLNPNDVELNENIEIANSQIKGDVQEISEFILITWWNKTAFLFHSVTWSIIGFIFISIGLIIILLGLFGSSKQNKKRFYPLGAALMIFSFLPFIFAIQMNYWESDKEIAFLMVDETSLRSSPDGIGEFQIFEGTKLKLEDRIGEWYKVKLINGDVGWIKESEMEKI